MWYIRGLEMGAHMVSFRTRKGRTPNGAHDTPYMHTPKGTPQKGVFGPHIWTPNIPPIIPLKGGSEGYMDI